MRLLSVLILFSVFLTVSACSPRAPISNRDVIFAIEQSHDIVKVGESVTFTAHATGTAGRDEKIKWKTDAGELSLVDDKERYARVVFKDPGLFTVEAVLYVDGKLVDTERASVKVEPLY